MSSDFLPDLSPEQKIAHKFAAQELAKYCKEFSLWRNARQRKPSLDNSFPSGRPLGPVPIKKPQSLSPRSSA